MSEIKKPTTPLVVISEEEQKKALVMEIVVPPSSNRPAADPRPPVFIMEDVTKIFEVSRSTIHRWIANARKDIGSFPTPEKKVISGGLRLEWNCDAIIGYLNSQNCETPQSPSTPVNRKNLTFDVEDLMYRFKKTRVTIYRWAKKARSGHGTFPPPINTGGRERQKLVWSKDAIVAFEKNQNTGRPQPPLDSVSAVKDCEQLE